MALRLGDEAPNFTAETTEGTINLYDYLGDSWGVLFSHPKDFTPVCTTELGDDGEAQARVRQAQREGPRPVGRPARRTTRAGRTTSRRRRAPRSNFPLIADTDCKVAEALRHAPATLGRPGQATPADNMTVRNVFVIGPDKKVKLILIYPMSTGRNFDEILRVIDSLQLTAKYSVATPVNWKDGEDVIIAARRLRRGRQGEVPEGLEGGQAVPAGDAAAEQVTGRAGRSLAEVVPAALVEVEAVAPPAAPRAGRGRGTRRRRCRRVTAPPPSTKWKRGT